MLVAELLGKLPWDISSKHCYPVLLIFTNVYVNIEQGLLLGPFVVEFGRLVAFFRVISAIELFGLLRNRHFALLLWLLGVVALVTVGIVMAPG